MSDHGITHGAGEPTGTCKTAATLKARKAIRSSAVGGLTDALAIAFGYKILTVSHEHHGPG